MLIATVIPVAGTLNEVTSSESYSYIPINFKEPSISPGDYYRFMIYDGHIRSYRIHIPPSYDEENPMPLVISVHGFTSNSMSNEIMTGLSEKADEEGFIAVYPNGATDMLFLMFSRILSNTTIVSLMEYPMIVRIAATIGRSISLFRIEKTPMVIIAS